jgi:hypothetical protein
MGGGFAARFLVEAIFLILLAVAAAFADLSNRWIVIVMAAGWGVVTLIELLAWRLERRGVPEASFAPPRIDEEGAEARPDRWDIEEILAPLPEPEEPDHTRVLPAAEEPEGEARAG